MNEQQELEFLIEFSNQKIFALDNHQYVNFPPEFAHHLDIALRNIIGKKQVPKDTLEVLSECEKIGTKNLAALYEISQSNIINDQSPAAKIVLKYFGEDMHCFLIHDALNIASMFYHYRELCKWIQEGFVSYYQAKIDPKLIVETAENINQHSLAIIKLFKYPWQLLTYLARSHLGQEVRPVSVNLMSSLEEAATVISGRFFYRVSHDKNPNSPLKKSISIQGQNVNIWCYQGIIESILYNNIKTTIFHSSQMSGKVEFVCSKTTLIRVEY